MTNKQRELEQRNNELLVENWNLKHPEVPLRVRFWTGAREGEGRIGTAYTHATILSGHTPGIYIRDANDRNVGFVALSHVEAIDEVKSDA